MHLNSDVMVVESLHRMAVESLYRMAVESLHRMAEAVRTPSPLTCGDTAMVSDAIVGHGLIDKGAWRVPVTTDRARFISGLSPTLVHGALSASSCQHGASASGPRKLLRTADLPFVMMRP